MRSSVRLHELKTERKPIGKRYKEEPGVSRVKEKEEKKRKKRGV